MGGRKGGLPPHFQVIGPLLPPISCSNLPVEALARGRLRNQGREPGSLIQGHVGRTHEAVVRSKKPAREIVNSRH